MKVEEQSRSFIFATIGKETEENVKEWAFARGT